MFVVFNVYHVYLLFIKTKFIGFKINNKLQF